jgi:hypothetical protein
MFYAGGKKHKKIWAGGHSGNPYLVRHLVDPVRAVLAFWDYNDISVEEKAAMCGLTPGEFIGLNRLLSKDKTAAVEFCKVHGIPASASVKLCKPFRCNGCRARLNTLPCIQCWNGPDDDPHV